jgi:hypothetical protein
MPLAGYAPVSRRPCIVSNETRRRRDSTSTSAYVTAGIMHFISSEIVNLLERL